MFLIQPRRKGAYSENNLVGAARALRPDLFRCPVQPSRGSTRPPALSQLAWAHLKAVGQPAPESPPHRHPESSGSGRKRQLVSRGAYDGLFSKVRAKWQEGETRELHTYAR